MSIFDQFSGKLAAYPFSGTVCWWTGVSSRALFVVLYASKLASKLHRKIN
jgi:hypothetical protein